MEQFVLAGMNFVMGCILFAIGAMVVAVVISMFRDLNRRG